MKGGAFVPALVAALTPLIVLAVLVTVPTLGLLKWEPPVLWTSQFGVPGNYVSGDGNGVTAISVDNTGFYASGFIGRTFPGQKDLSSYLFLKRYDFNGNEAWTQRLPGTSGIYVNNINSISVGNDGVFVEGDLNGTAFLQKRDFNGTTAWTRQLPSYVYPSAGPSVLVAGGSNDILTYDSAGNLLWTKILPNATSVLVHVNSDGIYVAGTTGFLENSLDTKPFVSRYSFNGTLEWTRQFDEQAFACVCFPNGISSDASGVYVSGTTERALPGLALTSDEDAFVRKYDMNGNIIWTTQFGAPDRTSTGSAPITVGQSGIYLLVGTSGSEAGHHEFVMRYDARGNRVWSVSAQSSTNSFASGGGGVFLGGTLGPDQGSQAFLTRLSSSSSLILFGLNPPFSFLLAGLLAASAIVSIFWLRRNWRKKVRRPPSTYDATRKTRSEPSFPINKPA